MRLRPREFTCFPGSHSQEIPPSGARNSEPWSLGFVPTPHCWSGALPASVQGFPSCLLPHLVTGLFPSPDFCLKAEATCFRVVSWAWKLCERSVEGKREGIAVPATQDATAKVGHLTRRIKLLSTVDAMSAPYV